MVSQRADSKFQHTVCVGPTMLLGYMVRFCFISHTVHLVGAIEHRLMYVRVKVCAFTREFVGIRRHTHDAGIITV